MNLRAKAEIVPLREQEIVALTAMLRHALERIEALDRTAADAAPLATSQD